MIKTIKDILDHIRGFHSQLSEFYSNLSIKSHKQRVKMLLDYMSDQEKHLEKTLTRYEEEVNGKILETTSRFSPPGDLLTTCKETTIAGKKDLTVDDVIEMAIKLNQCLQDLYNRMIENAETPEVHELFQNLLEMEKRYERELVRDAQELKDL